MNATTANNALLILAQSDTTAGFLCENPAILNATKKRDENKPSLREAGSFQTLKSFVRIPKSHRIFVRRAKKTTFIYPNNCAFRVISHTHSHHELLELFPTPLYSSSANLHKQNFDKSKALQCADLLMLDSRDLSERESSRIFKLSKIKKYKIR
ncbi:Sua5 YciO YrdC YwlC family protein [Helicobacter sp. MIT 00-7814]|uniref:Sua5 YciO YrdC YwlC family protein n=1 Tax=unclassified Helicobacter TaxID=2593540 RepID=UPI000E1FA0FD|nr:MULTISPECIES: Sua5 YciO YrdC YwlC family protein [unclassified Helicobacter]RDU55002.1 Sua5 YciO YrdC YwlC family protein [Helicobacter sp. MIT 00-7814]RDU55967.1 Sua5 YciO YrdC YwlC family protein [Helicobacter sp. MIT 99-10781]